MSPLIERFISLILAGYGKQREKLGPGAREELMERLHSRSGIAGQEEALAEACERFERNPPTQSRWAVWRAAAFNLTPLLVFLAVSWWYLPDYYLTDRPDWLPASQVGRIEARQASLILRPLPEHSSWGKFGNLPFLPEHLLDPHSPEDIQMVALNLRASAKFDWHTAWREADPDNSWYLLQQADALARKAIDDAEAVKKSLKRGSPRPPLNPATIAELLPLCEEAARLPHFVDYTQRPILRQIACLRPPQSASENLLELHLSPYERTGGLSYLRQALLDQLNERDLSGDNTGLVHLANLVRRVGLLASQQTGASPEEWNSYAGFFGLGSIKSTLTRGGPATALPLLADISERNLAAYNRSTRIELSPYSLKKWELALAEGLASHRFPAVPRELDYPRPERLLRYNWLDQRFAWFLALVTSIGLPLIVGFYTMVGRASPTVKAGSILGRLHRRGALIRTLLFGLIFPASAWLVLMVATPLGLRDLSYDIIEIPDWMKGGLWLALILSGALLVLTAILFLARRESYKRFAFLSLCSPDLLTGWAPLALALIAPMLFGIPRWMTNRDLQWKYEAAAAGLLGLVAIAVLFRTTSPFLHFRSAALGSVLTFRLVRPVLWTLSVGATLSIPVLKHWEAQWISELPPSDERVDTPQWLHDHTQAFRIAIREEFANEPPYTGE